MTTELTISYSTLLSTLPMGGNWADFLLLSWTDITAKVQPFLAEHWLDILGTITGLIYIYQEYKASIWLWLTGIIMPIIYIFVYLDAGLYADFGMQVYYTLAAIYGFVAWKFFKKDDSESDSAEITHLPKKYILPSIVAFAVLWYGIFLILIHFTNSNVPVLDSCANALSVIGLWALAKKYIEQWWIWVVVDAGLSALYVYKEIPFTAGLYALYVIIAIAGYFKWKRMMVTDE